MGVDQVRGEARQREPSSASVPALLGLTFVTGLVDAASVLGMGHVFVANMTGNVVFLGFALAGHQTVSIAGSVVAIAGFLAGAVVGGRLGHGNVRRGVLGALGIELAMLAGAAVATGASCRTEILVALLGLAMGIRNAVVRSLGVTDMTTTVLTLTLTGLAADSSLAGGASPRWPRRIASAVTMLLGALAGGLLIHTGLVWVVGTAALVEGASIVALARAVGGSGTARRRR